MADSDHDEILRLRDWRHGNVDPALLAYRLRLTALEKRMARVEPKVEAMAKADEIAGIVADKLHERRGQLFTAWQKTGAALVGVIALADFVRGMVVG